MKAKVQASQKAYDFECAIIGAGPGGLVSGLYLERYKRKIVIFDSMDSRAQWAPRIRNLIGYTNGISGRHLLFQLRKQVSAYNPRFVKGEACVQRKKSAFEISVGDSKFTAQTVILATGMKDIQPDVPNVTSLRKKGLLAYCPICDGFDHSKQKVGLLVRDNHGLKKVSFLAKFSPNLRVFTTQKFRVASHHIQTMHKLGIRFYSEPIQSLEANKGLQVNFELGRPVHVDLAYVGLGSYLNDHAFKGLKKLKRKKDGFIMTTSHQETSIPGLYAVGDCAQGLSQVSVAVGHAAVAATQIHNRLLKKESQQGK
jgi:thioredoxin reductase (NADPH)